VRRATWVFLAAAVLAAGGCSGTKLTGTPGPTLSEQALKKDCDNPQWKQENLGLWYSVCREPLRW